MYYQSIEDSNNFLVDERYDDMFPTNNNQQGEHKLEHALKKLSIDNHTTTNNENCCKDLNSDVFYFKEDIDDDYDSIQPVSNITANKMTNVYIPMISPIIEEEEAESEEDGESISENMTEKDEHDDFDETLSSHSSTCSVYDYNSDLVQYYKSLILHTMDPDTTSKNTLQSIDSTLPNTYKHYIQLIQKSNSYF